MPPRGKGFIEAITDLFSTFVCALLTFAALKFIKNEVQMGNVAFPGVPSWIAEIILPITFAVMTLRFGFRSLRNFSRTIRNNTTPAQREGK
jgi:TRAP-type C4-dicarboxylate transport system permease small subunit